MEISQFVENSSTYEKLMNLLNFYDPVEILLPNTSSNSTISEIIKEECKTWFAKEKVMETC